MPQVIWKQASRFSYLLSVLFDLLIGVPMLVLARWAKGIHTLPCPDKEEILLVFRPWANQAANTAIDAGVVTQELLDTRKDFYKTLHPEELTSCASWVSRYGSNSIASLSEEALRLRLLELGVEIQK